MTLNIRSGLLKDSFANQKKRLFLFFHRQLLLLSFAFAVSSGKAGSGNGLHLPKI
jgi:hypothetical protein